MAGGRADSQGKSTQSPVAAVTLDTPPPQEHWVAWQLLVSGLRRRELEKGVAVSLSRREATTC